MLTAAMGEDCRPLDEQRQRLLDEQLIPLSVAAAVAYLDVAGPEPQAERIEYAVRAIDLAAMSLAQLVPIYFSEAGRRELSAQEVRERLVRPLREGHERPSLDRFLVRRCDLRTAIKTLKGAGMPFQ
jgi:hypothetical protein